MGTEGKEICDDMPKECIDKAAIMMGEKFPYVGSTNGYRMVKAHAVTYQSRNNLTGGGKVQVGGAGMKGVDVESGQQVEFIRNMGYEVRPGIFAIKWDYIFFNGDLDEVLKEKGMVEESNDGK